MGETPLRVEIAKKLAPADAKAFTDELKRRMYKRWDERVFGASFMRDLEAGKLPIETIRLFWGNWYSYPVEVGAGAFFPRLLKAGCQRFSTPSEYSRNINIWAYTRPSRLRDLSLIGDGFE